MLRKLFYGILTAGLLAAGIPAAGAATLSVIGGDAATIGGGFDLAAETGLASGDSGLLFTRNNSGGLYLGGGGTVTFTYLGSEADHSNSFVVGGATAFANTSAFSGQVFTETLTADGYVPVAFVTEYVEWNCNRHGRCRAKYREDGAVNDGKIDRGLSIALFEETSSSFIMLFGDGSGDRDFDDFAVRVSVTAVPLPPALLLFGGAVIGLAFLSYRRRSRGA
jgi:hypothetical protein